MTENFLINKAFIAAIVKALSALIAFVLTLVITRTLNVSESGLFLLALSFLAAATVFCRLGLDNVVLRLISATDSQAEASKVMLTGVVWVLLFSLPLVLFIYIFASDLSGFINKPDFGPILSVVIWALPCMALYTLIGAGFQADHKVIITTLFQNLGISILFLFLFILCFSLGSQALSAELASIIYLISALIVLFLACVMWFKSVGCCMKIPTFIDSKMWAACSNLWVASTMNLAVQWAGILIAGAFVIAEDIAYLSAAQRTALLTSFVLMVINMVVAPRYARLWKEDKLKEIQKLAKWSTRGMIALALPVVLAMLVVPEFIMGLFGDGYEQGAVLLSIMAVGQFINVATGSVSYLLNMSGHERDFRRVTMFAGPLTIVLSFVLINLFGVTGAAIAIAIGLSLQNLGALYMVKKRLGFWPIG